MINTAITEEVLSLTFNGDSFPMSTEIPLEKIKLVDPKNISEIKRVLREQEIRLVIVDGTLCFLTLMAAIQAVREVRKKRKLNITICVVNQDTVTIEGVIWVQKPENTKKYLLAA